MLLAQNVLQVIQSFGEVMDLILRDVKTSIGIQTNNLGFDHELLMILNAAASDLVQIGVEEFEGITIAATTSWPTFTNTVIDALVRQCMVLKTKVMFDPRASETINKSVTTSIINLEGRIRHEIGEVENA